MQNMQTQLLYTKLQIVFYAFIYIQQLSPYTVAPLILLRVGLSIWFPDQIASAGSTKRSGDGVAEKATIRDLISPLFGIGLFLPNPMSLKALASISLTLL